MTRVELFDIVKLYVTGRKTLLCHVLVPTCNVQQMILAAKENSPTVISAMLVQSTETMLVSCIITAWGKLYSFFFYFIPLSSYFFPPSCKQLIIKLHLNYKLPTLGGKILLEILKGWYVKIGEKQLFWKCCLFLCSECYLNIGRGPH